MLDQARCRIFSREAPSSLRTLPASPLSCTIASSRCSVETYSSLSASASDSALSITFFKRGADVSLAGRAGDLRQAIQSFLQSLGYRARAARRVFAAARRPLPLSVPATRTANALRRWPGGCAFRRALELAAVLLVILSSVYLDRILLFSPCCQKAKHRFSSCQENEKARNRREISRRERRKSRCSIEVREKRRFRSGLFVFEFEGLKELRFRRARRLNR